MATQTVNFTNPSVINSIQGLVNISTSQVNASQVNLTGALYNSTNQFVDKYTFPKGMGPYQIDCIPMVVKDTFAMPKFSQNSSSQTGGSNAINTGTNYTIPTFDTETSYDMIVFAPSSRTSMETSPMFPQTTPGQLDFIGTWGPLEDYRGPYAIPAENSFQSLYGSTGLGTAWFNFWNICSSGTTSTGARQTALNAVTSHPDYATIKANMKYPFKVFNQVKGVTEFNFDNLLDLNGSPLVNTGAAGNTGYYTQVTATTYSATGNLLSTGANENVIAGKMGLFLNFVGSGMSPNVLCYGYQAASLGYIVVNLPGSPLSQNYARYGGGFKTTSQLMADKVINVPVSNVTGIYADPVDMYGPTYDASVGGSSNGFYRTIVHSNSSTPPARLVFERYFYQIKCVLNKLGLSSFINYNNVIIAGYSLGGQPIQHSHILLSNSPAGYASQFTIQDGSKPFIWNIKACINFNGTFVDLSLKKDSALNEYSSTNNSIILANMIPLKVPMITITNDWDEGYTARSNDNYFNGQTQSIYQATKRKADYNTDRYVMGRSAVFYKPASYHAGSADGSKLKTDGGSDDGLYFNGFFSDWLQGWSIPMNPVFPTADNIYESGYQNELIYQQVMDMKMISLLTLLPHRWLGANFPFPEVGFANFGMRYDIGPTHCDVLTDHEYMRVGPWGQITYDYNYNLILTNVPGATGPTQPPVSFYATGSGQTIGATNMFTNVLTGAVLNITDRLNVANTIAAGTGSQTINKPAGQVIFGASDVTPIIITNNLVTASSIVIATVANNDTTLKSVSVECTGGSFTLYPNAASTANAKVNWMVVA